jgi:tetratricopeptide (TPR) repeat protein
LAGPKEDAARTKVSEATAAYNLGYYEDAAHHYEEAYRLILDPALLFNIGQAYRLAGKPERAITAYRSFLRTHTEDTPHRIQAEKRIQELETVIAENKRNTKPNALSNTKSDASPAPKFPDSPAADTSLPTGSPSLPHWPSMSQTQSSHHHHDALFIRLHFGGSYLSAWKNLPGSTINVRGPAFAFSAAFGWSATPSLIFYGEVVLMEASNPKVSSLASSSGTTMSMIGLGPGFAYYLQPKNIYFSGTITFPQISISSTSPEANLGNTDHGLGLSAAFGREWWVSSNWGIGAAFQLQLATMSDQGTDNRTTGLDLALLFSATYN